MEFLTSLFYTLAAIAAYAILKRLIHAQTNPLIHTVPGPWHTKYTSFVSKYHRFRGTKTMWVHSLFAVYGPVVRVEPHQVMSSDPANWEHMHRMGSGFRKAAFHERFRVGPEHMLFSIVDVKKHSARRRLFARALTKDAVRRNWEGVVRGRVEVCVGRLRREMEGAQDGEVDVLKWWRLMTADIIAQLSFGGESFRMLESGGESERGYFEVLQNAGVNIILRDLVPGWVLRGMASGLKMKGVRDVLKANEIITERGAVVVRNLREKKVESQNLFSNILAEAERAQQGEEDERAVRDLTDDAIISEAAGFLLAGSDTTSISITYALWAILKRPELRVKLEEEISKLGEDFTDKDMEEKLPLLNSVIEESFRLYNPAAGPLVRRVPPEGVTWNGCFIPGGNEVAVMLWTLGRNAEVYPDPERFDENRFLNPTDAQRRLAKPYSIGSRSCIGVPVANMELRYALVLFLRECKGARLGRNMTDEVMEQRNKFFSYPKGGRCDVRLGGLDSE